jgi:hypothetical protein
MDKKKNPWLPYIVIFVILLILLVFTQWKESGYEVTIKRIVDVKPESITSFTVFKDQSMVTLDHVDTLWVFTPPDSGSASMFKIKEFIREVLNGEREGAVTDDTSKYEKFGLTENKAIKLVIRQDDKVVVTIYTGRSVADYQQEYIRYENDPNVYPARQKMLSKMGASASWWR